MNGVSTGNYAYEGGMLSPTQAVGPGPRQIMNGYRKDVLSGLSTNQRYDAVSRARATCRITVLGVLLMPCPTDHHPRATGLA